MKEKIKSIALECYNPYGNFDIEKFAELIVKEFCQKLENDGMVEVAMEMKQHFGVKE